MAVVPEPDDDLAQLLDEERALRRAAEAAATRAAFLAQASALFLSSLGYEDTLQAIASAAIPQVADWCAVDLVDGPRVKSVAVAHADPAHVEAARALRRKYEPRANSSTGVTHVIRTGEPELFVEIPDELLRTNAQGAEHLASVRALGIRSAMLVPIKNRGTTLGVITFVIAESARRYSAVDLAMATQLGELAGAALANAQLYDQAVQAVRLNETFAGVVGHDLRNPLASIMAVAEVMLARGVTTDQEALLRRMLGSTERMARMIDQLLDFTRIRAGGGIPSDPAPTDLADVATHVIEELRVAHPARAVTWTSHGDLRGVWDADRLAQLLSNLVSNALIHGSETAPVEVDANGTHADRVEITVSNDGAIPESIAPHIFEPFRRATVRRGRTVGLGLGLFIARQIALVHGGAIDLVQAVPHRTTFQISLPRANMATP